MRARCSLADRTRSGSVDSPRIVLYGNFGSGNLGNECTLQAAIEHTRSRFPAADLLCICTVPEDVQHRHGIAAVRSTARGGGESWWSIVVPGAGVPPSADADSGAGQPAMGPLRRWARRLFHRLPLEIAHWVRCLRIAARSDALIVPGTQIVSDYLCGPFDWPYDIFKLSVAAALCRTKLIFLSVGVGPIRHPISRRLIRRSLELADYRSYRDEASRRCARDIGVDVGADSIYPDLAFGLGRPAQAAARDRAGRKTVIGLGLKDYVGPDNVAESGGYRRYLEIMAEFVAWLCANGYFVRLLIGDVQYDTRVRSDFLEMMRLRGAAAAQSLIVSEPALTVEELLRQLAETDAVVSPRFHNLVLAMKLDRPVIALSDHAKLDSLLAGLGLADYCLPLAALDAPTLIGRFGTLAANLESLRSQIRREIDRRRAALDEQYASVFAIVAPRARGVTLQPDAGSGSREASPARPSTDTRPGLPSDRT